MKLSPSTVKPSTCPSPHSMSQMTVVLERPPRLVLIVHGKQQTRKSWVGRTSKQGEEIIIYRSTRSRSLGWSAHVAMKVFASSESKSRASFVIKTDSRGEGIHINV